ncbi:MBL fold metallo-hydrolase [Anaeromicropila populeti]|uniref:7,8-dihydropterin-6-yl-methyl-4-(Beta-D-ribofuranosyl)aminobenzene 5'-phosphate synthase n=1 Tax=Anaeromicropila populeti TaxID=37658 RepID=A0A1I6JN66_9FIRM|nr:MBL fold metallo-hydrolase [Anaeromicropila populeti]SFR80415.1 7,8-dihydropterin-6-yl-methyl-4-(beta-D-ribofuranosyl)aminobenzene 5'-phosphate synthase [Anaeromicropila populeti]
MKIVVLMDNTASSAKLVKKSGMSLYIETSNHKILFDLGPNHLFFENAKKQGIDVSKVDTVILSSGHNAYGGGLRRFLEVNGMAKIYVSEYGFMPYYEQHLGVKLPCGLEAALESNEQIVKTRNLYFLDDEMQLFSGVIDMNELQKNKSKYFVKVNGETEQDTFVHEQYLMIKENGKTIIVAGGIHNGIQNILRKGEQMNNGMIDVVIADFHLYDASSKKGMKREEVKELGEMISRFAGRLYTLNCSIGDGFQLFQSVLGDKIRNLSLGDSVVI